MRESIGATWILSICLTFIMLFTAYLAISVNYAKAFKIKSHIISMIEENEGFSSDDGSSMEENIRTYLISQGYAASGNCDLHVTDDNTLAGMPVDTDWTLSSCVKLRDTSTNCNACIYSLDVEVGNDDICANQTYYKVITFFKFDMPILRNVMTFKVRGETKLIHDFANATCGDDEE